MGLPGARMSRATLELLKHAISSGTGLDSKHEPLNDEGLLSHTAPTLMALDMHAGAEIEFDDALFIDATKLKVPLSRKVFMAVANARVYTFC